jgi:hypothetical protein
MSIFLGFWRRYILPQGTPAQLVVEPYLWGSERQLRHKVLGCFLASALGFSVSSAVNRRP